MNLLVCLTNKKTFQRLSMPRSLCQAERPPLLFNVGWDTGVIITCIVNEVQIGKKGWSRKKNVFFCFLVIQTDHCLLLQRPKYLNYWEAIDIISQYCELTQENKRSSLFKNLFCTQNNAIRPSVFGGRVLVFEEEYTNYNCLGTHLPQTDQLTFVESTLVLA